MSWKQYAYLAVWVALGLCYVATPLKHMDAYAWDYDEGPQLQSAALAFYGYPLYRDVVLNKPPVLTWFLELGFAVGGVSLISGRFIVLLITLCGYLSLGFLAELLWGKPAGPITMATALMLPEISVRATVVMNELPAMSVAIGALVAATLFRRSASRVWLAVTAVLYALALGFHLLVVFMGVPIVWLLIAPAWSGDGHVESLIETLFLFCLVVLLVLGIMFVAVDGQGFMKWVYSYNADAQQAMDVRHAGWESIKEYVSGYGTLFFLGLLGAFHFFLNRESRVGLSTCLVWISVTFVTLLFLHPLWPHYLVLLLFPFLMLAGGGIRSGVTKLNVSPGSGPQGWLGVIHRALLIGGSVTLVSWRFNQPLEWPMWPEGYAEMSNQLSCDLEDSQFLLSDNQFLAFSSGCLVPPSMADTSHKRLSQGYLEPVDLLEAVDQWDVHGVLIDWEDGKFRRFPRVLSAIDSLFVETDCAGSLCFARERDYSNVHFVFGQAIDLRAYQLSEYFTAEVDRVLSVELLWESLVLIDEELYVFVHLLDEQGQVVRQHDGPPGLGRYRTMEWQRGDVVLDPHPLVLGPSFPSGTYTVAIGIYNWPSMERLQAHNEDGEHCLDDIVLLAEWELAPVDLPPPR